MSDPRDPVFPKPGLLVARDLNLALWSEIVFRGARATRSTGCDARYRDRCAGSLRTETPHCK